MSNLIKMMSLKPIGRRRPTVGRAMSRSGMTVPVEGDWTGRPGDSMILTHGSTRSVVVPRGRSRRRSVGVVVGTVAATASVLLRIISSSGIVFPAIAVYATVAGTVVGLYELGTVIL